MDIKKTKQGISKKYLIALCCAAVATLLIVMNTLQPNNLTIGRSSLVIGEVKQGNLAVSVSGYGVLRSNKQTLLTAKSNALVTEIFLRPGAEVDPDSIILTLDDPDLLQEIESQQMLVNQQQAAIRRQALANQRELLQEEAQLAQIDSEYQTLKFRRIAEQALHEQGVIAEIDVKTARLREDQLAQRVALQRTRIKQLKALHQEDIKISQEQLGQASSRLTRLSQRQNELTVRAGMSGVLQQLPITLGQSVLPGQELAQIGSSQDLQALIRVAQSKVDQLQVGQKAIVDTRREKVPAEVTRITPQVQDGTVEVELSFTQGVPQSARAELNVLADIQTQALSNVLYVEKPNNVNAHQSAELFTLAQATLATPTNIRFGEENDQFIQIISGANLADRIILSDMSLYRDHARIQIIQ